MRTHSRQKKSQRTAYLFLAPWIIGMLAFQVIPILSSLYLSFTSYAFSGLPKWVGLRNYTTLFSNDVLFRQSMKVTLIYVFISVPVVLTAALFIAMLLNRGMKGLGLFRAIYYLPSLIGGSVAVAILWRHIFGAEGIVNRCLSLFGILLPSWVGSPQYSLWSIVFLKIWQFGAPMVIFLAGLKNIPKELYEASFMDGANRTQQFFHITIPKLTPIIFFNLIQQIIGSFQAFTPAYIVSNGTGGPINSLLFYTLYIYQNAFGNFQMGYASAAAWILLLTIAVFTAIGFASSSKWVFYEN
jgi:multiple sugar transport system permease protein